MVMLLSPHSAASSKIFLSCKKHHHHHNASSYNYTSLRKSYSTASSSSSSCAEVEELPLPYSSPLLMLPPEYITVPRNEETLGMSHKNIVNFQFFSPTEKKFMKLSNRMLPPQICPSHYRMSSNGWLACVNRRDCSLHLLNIFSPSNSHQIIPLPPIDTLYHVRRDPSSKDKSALNNFLVCYDDNCDTHSVVSSFHLSSTILNRISLSSDPIKDKNCTVTICHNDLSSDAALSFCRIGDSAWTCLVKRRDFSPELVYSKKDRLFYTDADDKLEGWDLNNPSSPRRIKTGMALMRDETEADDICFYINWYFVESPAGDLLSVERTYSQIAGDGSFTSEDVPGAPYRTTWFAVYKFEFGKKGMYNVHCLGDTVLFVGRSEAFAVRASDHPTLKPNSIYFDDDAFPAVTLPDGSVGCAGHDIGVFDLETNEVTPTPLYEPFEMKKIMPAPLWVFPNP